MWIILTHKTTLNWQQSENQGIVFLVFSDLAQICNLQYLSHLASLSALVSVIWLFHLPLLAYNTVIRYFLINFVKEFLKIHKNP